MRDNNNGKYCFIMFLYFIDLQQHKKYKEYQFLKCSYNSNWKPAKGNTA